MIILLKKVNHFTPTDIWVKIQQEAEEAINKDNAVSTFLHSFILDQKNLETAVIHRLVHRLVCSDFDKNILQHVFFEAISSIEYWSDKLHADICAVLDRDPATSRFLDPVLYLKGFHAIQTYRVTHWLWQQGRKDMAYYLQSRSSEIFQTDIHPAAEIGSGIFLDHATGLVVGETALIEDNVSLLHSVTLGGTGKICGDRHPKIRHGVLIGAGAKILGNIDIGVGAKIASGSVVLSDVPAYATVAGVPARMISKSQGSDPAQTMDQLFNCGAGI